MKSQCYCIWISLPQVTPMPLSGSHWAPPLADFMLPQGHQPKRLNEVNPVKRKMTWDTQLQACNGEQMLTESVCTFKKYFQY